MKDGQAFNDAHLLSEAGLFELLRDLDETGRRELFGYLQQRLGNSEASRLWLSAYSPTDASET